MFVPLMPEPQASTELPKVNTTSPAEFMAPLLVAPYCTPPTARKA
jgi:hypothetical protein